MEKIVIDVDDVILNYASALIRHLNSNFGKNFRKKQVKSWDLAGYYPIETEEVIKVWEKFHETEQYSNLKIVDKAKEGMAELSKKGEIYLATYRDERFREKTERNLEKLPSIWEELIFTNGGRKRDIYKKLNASYVIDDSLRNVSDALQEKVENTILFDQPWNHQDDAKFNYRRYRGWDEIIGDMKN